MTAIQNPRNFYGEILRTKNPFNLYGYKGYSQNDEDGILAEIFARLDIKGDKTFAEFGVGNGLECNTLQFLIQGWRGCWVGNEQLAFTNPQDSPLLYINQTVTLDNLPHIAQLIKENYGTELTLLSMDFDGNDAYFLKELLFLKPKVIVVEYNSNIAPPGDFCIAYDADHRWRDDDYYGASLQHFVNILPDYKLICCGCTGVNAFFVAKEYSYLFHDVPTSINDIFIPAIYAIMRGGHKPSTKTIELVLNKHKK